MERAYNINSDNKDVTVAVAVGTIAPVKSAIFLKREGGQATPIANSGAKESGNIPSVSIGAGKTLNNARLAIRVALEMGAFTEKERKNALSSLFVSYTLTGGPAGQQVFNYDTDDVEPLDDDNSLVFVIKRINLV
ncbi:hypothetical protein [uncultured Hymenobacter sp.]|uniref:hypothetical protein n=1 Tax=uncultured Hymenobacter sp. TaxID=170016 RepID=UPI0035CA8D8B